MPAIELNGLFYVVGGFGPVTDGSANGKDAVETFEAYNPKADQWIALVPTPEARDHSMIPRKTNGHPVFPCRISAPDLAQR